MLCSIHRDGGGADHALPTTGLQESAQEASNHHFKHFGVIAAEWRIRCLASRDNRKVITHTGIIEVALGVAQPLLLQ